MKKPAVFVDRDGTLIEEVNFLSRIEDLRVFSYTPAAIRSLKEHGYRIIVLTNQSGIGRGIYSEAEMHAIHDQIQSEVGGLIDAFYFCPHLPGTGCSCRKPSLGMIESARSDFEIDMESSWMIGDKDLDVYIARNAGIKSAMVMTGYGREHHKTLREQPNVTAETFGEAVSSLLAGENAPASPTDGSIDDQNHHPA